MSSHKALPLKLSPSARQDFIDILRHTGETWGQNQLQVYRDKVEVGNLSFLRTDKAFEKCMETAHSRWRWVHKKLA